MAKAKKKQKTKGSTTKGSLIVFEGPDGVGKSTIAAGVAQALQSRGIACKLLSFPGRDEGSLGKLVYDLHHAPEAFGISALTPAARQALHVAAHLDVIERVILPALAAGANIVLDRFWWSTIVYGQSAGIADKVLDTLVAPELALWEDQNILVFLVDRDEPINRNEDPTYWQDLRSRYRAFARKAQKRSNVVDLPNLKTTQQAVADATTIAQSRLGLKARRATKNTSDQFAIEFAPVPEVTAPSQGTGPFIHNRIAPAKPTIVLDSYGRFAAERQDIFYRRLQGQRRPWTADPVIEAHKFTNAYRASDRVSQYLIRNVIYRSDLPDDPGEVCFRILLFKLFNKIETWELLEKSIGALTFESYSYRRYDQILGKALERGDRIYSAAYIMPPGGTAFGRTAKHQNHLCLLEKMMADELPSKLAGMNKMQQGFELLLSYPTIGPFLAYQFITDINYSEVTNFSEMEFVMPGPGALDGIRKCFSSLGGLNEPEIIRLMADIQSDEFARLGLQFRSLFGRSLQLIDCQNLFCEVDKYARVAHPEFSGLTGRSRIKQKFAPISKPIEFWYPPKWGINDAISAFQTRIPKTAA